MLRFAADLERGRIRFFFFFPFIVNFSERLDQQAFSLNMKCHGTK